MSLRANAISPYIRVHDFKERERVNGIDPSPVDSLRQSLDSLFTDPQFSNATFGVCIQSLKTGEYLYRLNDTKSLLPASNMKLFTAAEGLALLGPDFRYRTHFVTTGSVKVDAPNNISIHGDLIVIGSGDPSFGMDSAGFSPMGQSIHKVVGSILGEASYFTDERYPVGWSSEDLSYYYAPQVTALAFDENQASLNIICNANSGIGWEPRNPFDVIDLDIDNSAVVWKDLPSTIDVARIIGTNKVVIRGHMPCDTVIQGQSVSVEDPTRHAVNAMTAILREDNDTVTEEASTLQNLKNPYLYAKAHTVFTDSSSKLSDLVRHMNKESDNLYAECLFRTVAKEKGGQGSWTRGIEVMRRYLASIGIDTIPLQFTDGSGLSRMDYVTTDAIVRLLRAMWNDSKLNEPFYNSLPIAGVDGTFKNRLKGTPAEGNARGKSGSMTGVRALSGYLTTKDGEPLAYSVIANNFTVHGSDAGKLEDAVVLRLVNFSRK